MEAVAEQQGVPAALELAEATLDYTWERGFLETMIRICTEAGDDGAARLWKDRHQQVLRARPPPRPAPAPAEAGGSLPASCARRREAGQHAKTLELGEAFLNDSPRPPGHRHGPAPGRQGGHGDLGPRAGRPPAPEDPRRITRISPRSTTSASRWRNASPAPGRSKSASRCAGRTSRLAPDSRGRRLLSFPHPPEPVPPVALQGSRGRAQGPTSRSIPAPTTPAHARTISRPDQPVLAGGRRTASRRLLRKVRGRPPVPGRRGGPPRPHQAGTRDDPGTPRGGHRFHGQGQLHLPRRGPGQCRAASWRRPSPSAATTSR